MLIYTCHIFVPIHLMILYQIIIQPVDRAQCVNELLSSFTKYFKYFRTFKCESASNIYTHAYV